MMVTIDEQYWNDYAHLPSRTLAQAVQLTEPVVIDGKQMESGDYSVKFSSGVWQGVEKWKFENPKNFRPLGEWMNGKEHDAPTIQTICERLDDMIVSTARLAAAVERYGMVNDPAQK